MKNVSRRLHRRMKPLIETYKSLMKVEAPSPNLVLEHPVQPSVRPLADEADGVEGGGGGVTPSCGT